MNALDSNPLQNAAATGMATTSAAGAIDPNTMKAEAPQPGTTPVAQPISQERETFTDEWAKAPNDVPPVRTWRDAGSREGPQGEYLSAWYDTPAAQTAAPPIPDLTGGAPAAAPAAAAAPVQHKVNYVLGSDGENTETGFKFRTHDNQVLNTDAAGMAMVRNGSMTEDQMKSYGWKPPAPAAT